ncbi:unnamed protein product [Cuscuta epithymum]|uniref:CSN8/PSMD8/EIF3K domain-containing protein n=1 Tax=Cuscuta epithymum TaxID=186058 RepID=A0AAV0GLC1_9ASTE|nr:unnamed protein product [Cuscuta epithymum]CAH9139466.1 unnamed protein product [Cuscuta epithymum]CAH9148530.1 unnamed protein product [Cuscuta epithymum]
MEFSRLTEALASKSYDKIPVICDDLMLSFAAKGITFHEEWPYTIHLLGHLYNNDIFSARFLWKTTPAEIKVNRPEMAAVWKIGQKLWKRDYAGVHEALRAHDWSPEVREIVVSIADRYTKKMFDLLVSAYSTISVQETALFMGMNLDDATQYVLQQGWSLDAATQMLTVKRQEVVKEQKLDATKLQRLTEYVFHLEH